MINYLKELLTEGNEYSLTRAMAAISFMAFLIGSFYLLIKGVSWGNYETFATLLVVEVLILVMHIMILILASTLICQVLYTEELIPSNHQVYN